MSHCVKYNCKMDLQLYFRSINPCSENLKVYVMVLSYSAKLLTTAKYVSFILKSEKNIISTSY